MNGRRVDVVAAIDVSGELGRERVISSPGHAEGYLREILWEICFRDIAPMFLDCGALGVEEGNSSYKCARGCMIKGTRLLEIEEHSLGVVFLCFFGWFSAAEAFGAESNPVGDERGEFVRRSESDEGLGEAGIEDAPACGEFGGLGFRKGACEGCEETLADVFPHGGEGRGEAFIGEDQDAAGDFQEIRFFHFQPGGGGGEGFRIGGDDFLESSHFSGALVLGLFEGFEAFFAEWLEQAHHEKVHQAFAAAEVVVHGCDVGFHGSGHIADGDRIEAIFGNKQLCSIEEFPLRAIFRYFQNTHSNQPSDQGMIVNPGRL